jgi:hypothetical protein
MLASIYYGIWPQKATTMLQRAAVARRILPGVDKASVSTDSLLDRPTVLDRSSESVLDVGVFVPVCHFGMSAFRLECQIIMGRLSLT